MPIEGGLQKVAAAAKISLSAMQTELQDLSASCAQLQRLLESLSLPDLNPFVEVNPLHIPGLSYTMEVQHGHPHCLIELSASNHGLQCHSRLQVTYVNIKAVTLTPMTVEMCIVL